MRETFLSFFDSKGHTRIDPYPVIARWRDDIHLTIASIADFQPHVTSGMVPPPANPLGISQPCIRLTDVAAVGRSGRHLSTFEMMAHHAFNRPMDGNVVYWIDQCVRYCDELLVEKLGIESTSITYVENPWSGGKCWTSIGSNRGGIRACYFGLYESGRGRRRRNNNQGAEVQ